MKAAGLFRHHLRRRPGIDAHARYLSFPGLGCRGRLGCGGLLPRRLRAPGRWPRGRRRRRPAMVHAPERALPVRVLGDHAPVGPDGIEAAAVPEAASFYLGVHRLRCLLVVVKRPQVARAALQPRLPIAPRRHPGHAMETRRPMGMPRLSFWFSRRLRHALLAPGRRAAALPRVDGRPRVPLLVLVLRALGFDARRGGGRAPRRRRPLPRGMLPRGIRRRSPSTSTTATTTPAETRPRSPSTPGTRRRRTTAPAPRSEHACWTSRSRARREEACF